MKKYLKLFAFAGVSSMVAVASLTLVLPSPKAYAFAFRSGVSATDDWGNTILFNLTMKDNLLHKVTLTISGEELNKYQEVLPHFLELDKDSSADPELLLQGIPPYLKSWEIQMDQEGALTSIKIELDQIPDSIEYDLEFTDEGQIEGMKWSREREEGQYELDIRTQGDGNNTLTMDFQPLLSPSPDFQGASLAVSANFTQVNSKPIPEPSLINGCLITLASLMLGSRKKKEAKKT